MYHPAPRSRLTADEIGVIVAVARVPTPEEAVQRANMIFSCQGRCLKLKASHVRWVLHKHGRQGTVDGRKQTADSPPTDGQDNARETESATTTGRAEVAAGSTTELEEGWVWVDHDPDLGGVSVMDYRQTLTEQRTEEVLEDATKIRTSQTSDGKVSNWNGVVDRDDMQLVLF